MHPFIKGYERVLVYYSKENYKNISLIELLKLPKAKCALILPPRTVKTRNNRQVHFGLSRKADLQDPRLSYLLASHSATMRSRSAADL